MKISSQLANNFDYCSAKAPLHPTIFFFAAFTLISPNLAPFASLREVNLRIYFPAQHVLRRRKGR